MNKNGFTLIESLIAISVVGSLSVGIIASQIEKNKTDSAVKLINEAANVISAVDTRISIDGYDFDLWNRNTWTDRNAVVNDLIARHLVPANSTTCNTGTWIPIVNSEESAKLIDCNQWSNSTNPMLMEATLREDSIGYIEGFDLILSYPDDLTFDEEFQDMKVGFNSIKAKVYNEITGIYFFDLISMTTRQEISTVECLGQKSNCGFRFSYERGGGFEYLRLDASNSMIDSHLTFVESKGNAPLKCQRWRNSLADGSGSWNLVNPDDNCGIGIYSVTGHPSVVEVVAENGTFQNLILDKECDVYEPKSTNGSVLGARANGTSPCGLLSNGEAIQVVETIHTQNILSEQGDFEDISTKSLIAKELNTKNIIATQFVNLRNIEVSRDLEVISGSMTVDGTTNITGDLNVVRNAFLNTINARNVSSSTTIDAPVGDFDNINNNLQSMEGTLNTINSNVNALKGSWVTGPWGSCSKSCDTGYQTRSVSCNGDYCTGNVPSTAQSCKIKDCPPPPPPAPTWDPNRGDNGGSGNGSDSGHEGGGNKR